MSLPPGSHLDRYEVLGLLGQGGMGQVFRARDPRLDREVAIKVLPPEFAKDEERLRRFSAEARATGALHHPGILSVFDVGVHEGRAFLVMELLQGESLEARLRHGPLAPRKAAELGVQVARGLAAAHDRGIVHRDIKPANLFLCAGGVVKILDFGLAKVHAAGRRPEEEATAALSAPGMILGTPGYMAPEQIHGETADARADIFALGAVLYEAITGERAFRGASSYEAITAILREDPPPISQRIPSVPPTLEAIVRACLEKDPAERFQNARDLAFALERLAAPSSAAQSAPALPAPAHVGRLRRWALPGLAVLGLAATAFTLGALLRPPASPFLGAGFQRLTYQRGWIPGARFSPDGRSILYAARWNGGEARIYSRTGGAEGVAIPDLTGASLVAVSPSGELALAPDAGSQLVLVRPGSSAPRPVADGFVCGDIGPDERIAMVRQVGTRQRLEYPLGTACFETAGRITALRVSPDGARVAVVEHPDGAEEAPGRILLVEAGKARPLTEPVRDLLGLAWAPGGKELWFTGQDASGTPALLSVALGGRVRRLLPLPAGLNLSDVAPDGRVLFVQEHSTGFLQFFPGEGKPPVDLSWQDRPTLTRIAPDGSWILFSEWGAATRYRHQAFLRRTDGRPPLLLGEGVPRDLSPDGQWALVQDGTRRTLRLVPLDLGQAREVDPGEAGRPSGSFAAFLPDGRILFEATAAGGPQGFVLDPKGGRPQAVTPSGFTLQGSLAPDGRHFLALAQGAFHLCDLLGGPARPVAGIRAQERPVGWSSDSRAVLVRSRDRSRGEVFWVDLAQGTRRPWCDTTPSDRAGLMTARARFSRDGRSWVTNEQRLLMDLVLLVPGGRHTEEHGAPAPR